MLKNVLGVIAGYIVVVLFTIVGLLVVYSLMGTNWAFKPESFQASTRWSAASVVIGFVGAVVAGWLCFLIANNKKAVKALAGLFIVLGLAGAIYNLTKEKTTDKRPAEMAFVEAGEKAYSPDWYNFVIPIVGAAGVMIGGGMKKEE